MSGPYRCCDCGIPLPYASPPLCDRCLDVRCCPYCRIGGDLLQDWDTAQFVHLGCLTRALEAVGRSPVQARQEACDRLGLASAVADATAVVEQQMRTEIGLVITAIEARTFRPDHEDGV